jgi:hypothetical protein
LIAIHNEIGVQLVDQIEILPIGLEDRMARPAPG